jgi:hypothetical protein
MPNAMAKRIIVLSLLSIVTRTHVRVHAFTNPDIHAKIGVQSIKLQSTKSTIVDRERLANQFQVDLEREGLALCHGMLHASGCRKISDLRLLTTDQIETMGTDSFDRIVLRRVMANQSRIMNDRQISKLFCIFFALCSVNYLEFTEQSTSFV